MRNSRASSTRHSEHGRAAIEPRRLDVFPVRWPRTHLSHRQAPPHPGQLGQVAVQVLAPDTMVRRPRPGAFLRRSDRATISRPCPTTGEVSEASQSRQRPRAARCGAPPRAFRRLFPCNAGCVASAAMRNRCQAALELPLICVCAPRASLAHGRPRRQDLLAGRGAPSNQTRPGRE
jgi:hypothetical protein